MRFIWNKFYYFRWEDKAFRKSKRVVLRYACRGMLKICKKFYFSSTFFLKLIFGHPLAQS